MAVVAWETSIRNGKVLNVFPSAKLSKGWLDALKTSIVAFNNLKLNVTFAIPNNAQAIPPDGEDGVEVQFNMGRGTITNQAHGTTFTLTDKAGQVVNFSGTSLHGSTQTLKRSFGGPHLIRRAFITVPDKPQMSATGGQRDAGPNILNFIAFHELIHATGLSNDEHSATGPNADGFTIFPTADAGKTAKDDRMILNSNPPRIFAPPLTISPRVVGLINGNW
ncbi:hypothetical protein [Enterovirga sp. CN4-39]|uniref:hypothetical protein n=1 Tax=Enterovirga sp. CN4-39 TaxID=3400910 RepID=UPI003C120C47